MSLAEELRQRDAEVSLTAWLARLGRALVAWRRRRDGLHREETLRDTASAEDAVTRAIREGARRAEEKQS